MVAAQPDADLIRRIIEKERAAVLDEVDRRYGGIGRADVVNVVFHFGTIGLPVATGDQAIVRLGLNAAVEIIGWSLGADRVGSCAVDVLAGDVLASAASITGATHPALAGLREIPDYLLPRGTDWTTRLSDGQWAVATILSADGAIEVLSLTLRCRKTSGALTAPLAVVTDSTGAIIVDSTGAIITARG